MSSINSIRHNKITSARQVTDCFVEQKIKTVQKLCPTTWVFVCPILPTKLPHINMHVRHFNSLLTSYVSHTNHSCTTLLMYSDFADNTECLAKSLSRYMVWDNLHLGSGGIRKLVSYIHESVLRHRTDTRSYATISTTSRGNVPGTSRLTFPP